MKCRDPKRVGGMTNPVLYSREFPDPDIPGSPHCSCIYLQRGLAACEGEFNDRGKYVQCH